MNQMHGYFFGSLAVAVFVLGYSVFNIQRSFLSIITMLINAAFFLMYLNVKSIDPIITFYSINVFMFIIGLILLLHLVLLHLLY